MIDLIGQLNSFTPLGIIGLLVLIVWQFVKDFRQPKAAQETVDAIAHNHLHGLPDMADTLKRIEQSLAENNKLTNQILNEVTYVKARINGKH